MAKASTQWYQVTDKSDLTYNGKTVGKGSVVSDIPSESIGWLLAQGNITPVMAPSNGNATVTPTIVSSLQAKFAEARAQANATTPPATPETAPATPSTPEETPAPAETTTTEGK